MAAASGKNNTIKLAVVIGALVVAIALPAWYFLSSESVPPTPPAPTNVQQPEAEQQLQQLRERPPTPVQVDGA